MATKKNCVYIYDGLGASEMSKIHLKRSLVENLSTRYDVNFISPDDIIKGTWTRDAALMAFGGGFDKGFIRTLGTTGVEKIRSYVINGGKYLGICAGGYFGCDYIEFDKGGPLEVCGERHLKFFPGCGRGPVYPGFKYNDLEGSRAAPIDFKTSGTSREVILTYFYGGGCFLLKESNQIKPTWNPQRNERLDTIVKHLKPPSKSQGHKHSHDKNFLISFQEYDRTGNIGGIAGSHAASNLASRTDICKTVPQNHEVFDDAAGKSNFTTNKEVKYQNTGLLQAVDDGSESDALNLNHDIISNDRYHDTTELHDPVNKNSGPTLEVSDVEILSRYFELPGAPPAIVKSRVGQGRAILCGVHIEYIPGLFLEMEPTLEELVKTLKDTEKQRLGCFRSLLQQLDLEVKII